MQIYGRATLKRASTGSEFVYPMFVINGEGEREPVPSMPGIARMTTDEAMREMDRALDVGVDRFLFFGIPDEKDATGTRAWSPEEAVQTTVAELRSRFPEATAITDVCMCEYTDHGHCGQLNEDGEVDNDATLPLLAAAAVSHADAGAQSGRAVGNDGRSSGRDPIGAR